MNRKLYPPDWNDIALKVKAKANWKCEQCGKPCKRPWETTLEMQQRIDKDEIWKNILYDKCIAHTQRFTLTVAHMNHKPEDCSEENLKALCAPCHIRYDKDPTQAAIRKQINQERDGQLNLLQ